MKKSFSTFEACKIIGLKYQRLRMWIDSGFIRPSIRTADGIGDRTAFSERDLLIIALFEALTSEGFSRKKAAIRALRLVDYFNLAETWDKPDQNAYLIVDKEDSAEVEKGHLERPAAVILSEQWFKEKPLFELLSHRGWYKKPDSFSRLTIINFKKIRDQIKAAMA